MNAPMSGMESEELTTSRKMRQDTAARNPGTSDDLSGFGTASTDRDEVGRSRAVLPRTWIPGETGLTTPANRHGINILYPIGSPDRLRRSEFPERLASRRTVPSVGCVRRANVGRAA